MDLFNCIKAADPKENVYFLPLRFKNVFAFNICFPPLVCKISTIKIREKTKNQ